MQFSPFKLLYGEEAMLSQELCLGTWRDIPSSDEDLKASVQNIEEVRLQAATNLSSYQEETRRWKNKKIRPKLGGPSATQDTEGKAERQDAREMGRPVYSYCNIERSSIQVVSIDRRRRALHMECGHDSEVLSLKSP
jgi:hypothetical protein